MNLSRNRGFISAIEQAKLSGAHIAIGGVGGDGGQIAETLCRMGVQSFSLADPEVFEEENLNRQNSSTTLTLGRNKAVVLGETLKAINPDVVVKIFSDGITPENVVEFVAGASLVIDETEYTKPELAVMLARASRARNLPLLTGLNVGFGCLVTSFAPSGRTLEQYLGFSESATLEDISLTKVPLSKWVPRLPRYAHEQAFRLVDSGSISTPSVAPGVTMTASAVATEAFNHICGRRKPIYAPHWLWVDVLERKARVICFPRLSFAVSLIRLLLRSRLGQNEITLSKS